MRAIFDKQDAHAQLERKRANAQKKLEKDGVLTRELNRAIDRMETPEELKELLAPFQTKRRTKAAKAREQGLEPIADAVWHDRVSESRFKSMCAKRHLEGEGKGVQHILAERCASHERARDQ